MKSEIKKYTPQEDIRHQLEDFPGFCNLLMKRIFPLSSWVANATGKVLLFINLIDRNTIEQIKKQILRYGGIEELKNLLGEEHFIGGNQSLTDKVHELMDYQIPFQAAKESGRLLEQFQDGDLEMEDIQIDQLSNYFSSFLKEAIFDNEGQRHEYPIIDYFFDIVQDYYISLPLIQFGNFDGIISIIFEQKDSESFKNIFVRKQLIRQISLEYEELLLNWDLVGGNIQRKSTLPKRLDYLISEEYASVTNPIFEELNYQRYYRESRAYFLERIKHNDAVPVYIKNEHRKRAIISILIDSYAHNISAHSLTVLKWWFQQRAMGNKVEDLMEQLEVEMPLEQWGGPLVDFLIGKFPAPYTRTDIGEGLKYTLALWYSRLEKRQETEDFKAVRDQLLSLENQLTPLFKFLLEKGAFWSGVTRDQQFGGEIHNLYKILWDDFIQNPLYLGTIAYSEGITKLNICIRIYSGEKFTGKKDDHFRTYQIGQAEDNTPLDGVLAHVEVGGVPFNQLRHQFVKEGDLHKQLKEALEQVEVFFPGGVVGKHAFFTLLENEIRNVKHFPETELQNMQDNGLNLVIAIRPSGLASQLNYKRNALYKIGIWLGHQTGFHSQKGHLALVRFNNLLEDIITPDTNEARLGGTYQDKICASMLFNNTFISVEKQESERDKEYYPWVRAAFSSGPKENGITEQDFEVNKRNYKAAETKLSESNLPKNGFFKKYIYLWKGDFIFNAKREGNLKFENVNRFRIVNLPKPKVGLRKSLLKEGVIRILEKHPSDISPKAAYHQWLQGWTKEKYFSIHLLQGETGVGFIFFSKKTAQYFPKAVFFNLPQNEQGNYGEYPKSVLKFAHHSSLQHNNQADIVSIRSHGVLKEKFFHGVQTVEDFNKGTIGSLELYELIEVLKTRVCIFDKRVADRVLTDKRDLLINQLGCEIYGEKMEEWEKVQKIGIGQYHFIVMHLSFIEAMKNKKGRRYGEDGIVDFINDHLDNKLAKNCILVITTGRGRTKWWRKIQESKYAIHTTFRPVESLIEAVEKAIMKKDDIELKYHLIKVLFGS